MSELLPVPAEVAVEYGRAVPDSRPDQVAESLLVVAVVDLRLHGQQRLPQGGRPGDVEVVDGSPEATRDFNTVEGPVSHDVELLSRPQPGGHCRRLPLTEETVRVSAAEHLHGGVGQRLEPPEPSYRELSVEVSNTGQVSRVTQVNEAIVTVELAEEVQGLGVLAGHVVVDPQPPPREQSPGCLCEWLEQSQEPPHSVSGVTALQPPAKSRDCETTDQSVLG